MIHSIKMFNLLAQSKLRIKIKIALVYDYIPIIISKRMFSAFTIFLRFIYFVDFKEPAYGYLNSSFKFINFYIYLFPFSFLLFFCYSFPSYLS